MIRKLVIALIVTAATLELTERVQTANAGTSDNTVSLAAASPSAPVTPTPTPSTLPLTNADFETGPFDTIGTVTGWTVVGNVGDRSAEGSSSLSHAAVFTLGGDSEGDILSQQFVSNVNKVYMLDFDAGVFGIPNSGANLQIRVQVTGNSTLLDQTITPPVAGTTDPTMMSFQHYHFIFTADSGTTTLQFTSVGLGNQSADQVLDAVDVALAP